MIQGHHDIGTARRQLGITDEQVLLEAYHEYLSRKRCGDEGTPEGDYYMAERRLYLQRLVNVVPIRRSVNIAA